MVPKMRVNADGSLGEPNDVVCGGIEHKLGIHGSPTCSMLFGGSGECEGYLLGEELSGMKLMFEMMNSARLEVGLQGLAVGGAAYQAAKSYAVERIQSRHWSQMRDKKAPPVAIIEHPDVRRMLMAAKAYGEAIRALLLRTAKCIDLSHLDKGEAAARNQALVELLTPVCKAWGSDWGFRITEWCLQVYGGYGYIKDYPAEQYLRDAKIASIYEGTNGIQALDLVARKLPANDGAAFRHVMGEVQKTIAAAAEVPELGGPAEQLAAAVRSLGKIVAEVPQRADAMQTLMLDAVPILDMVGHTLGGSFLLEQAVLAGSKLKALLEEKGVDSADASAYRQLLAADKEAAFLHDKIETAKFFAYRALPLVSAFAVATEAGDSSPVDAVLSPGATPAAVPTAVAEVVES
jgi:hypothetical protein